MKCKTTCASTKSDGYVYVDGDQNKEYNEIIIRVIDKLLELPCGEQIWAKEIKTLFNLLKV